LIVKHKQNALHCTW